MRPFHRLLDDVYIPGRWHLNDPRTDRGCEAWEFSLGAPIELNSTPVIDVDVGGAPLDFSLTNGAVPVASPRLVSAIAHLYKTFGPATFGWLSSFTISIQRNLSRLPSAM